MMPILCRDRCVLLVIDFQSGLMPAITGGAEAVANANRLLAAAAMLDVPTLFTEQNPSGLGATIPELKPSSAPIPKMTFDAARVPGFSNHLPEDHAIVVTGCEAHVCVLQTVLGLLARGRHVYVVRDAIGARKAESKETALGRMKSHGAEIVTTEMVIFE